MLVGKWPGRQWITLEYIQDRGVKLGLKERGEKYHLGGVLGNYNLNHFTQRSRMFTHLFHSFCGLTKCKDLDLDVGEKSILPLVMPLGGNFCREYYVSSELDSPEQSSWYRNDVFPHKTVFHPHFLDHAYGNSISHCPHFFKKSRTFEGKWSNCY